MPGTFRILACFILGTTLFISCKDDEVVETIYQPSSAYESYIHGLKETGIYSTHLGSSWIKAGEKAFDNPVNIPLPYSESFYIPSDQPEALSYRFKAKRGQIINMNLETSENDSIFIFVDLYRIDNDSLKQYTHIATADSAFHELKFEPRRDSEYILRIIPEILRGGKFSFEIKSIPLMAFPVTGKDKWAIQSKFGVPREGGKRQHHGVDIFAKRHTPIIAPIDAYVSEVDTAKLGGLVVWLKDRARGNNLYFAHLQEQKVTAGSYVYAGDTIGTVGNTGKARTTPTHLHFGIYSRGPVDPYNYIVRTDTITDPLNAKTEFIGNWVRVKQKVSLRTRYGRNYKVIKDYTPQSILFVEGIAGKYYRVRQADGVKGYVLARTIESISKPIQEFTANSNRSILRDLKDTYSIPITQGDTLKVLGKHEGYLYVETSNGISGWTSTD